VSKPETPLQEALESELDGLLDDLEGLKPVQRAVHLRALRYVANVPTEDVLLAAALFSTLKVNDDEDDLDETEGRKSGKPRAAKVELELLHDAEPISDRERSVYQLARQRLHEDFFARVIQAADARNGDGNVEAGAIFRAALTIALKRFGPKLIVAQFEKMAKLLNAKPTYMN
jgi:hypothetical protein